MLTFLVAQLHTLALLAQADMGAQLRADAKATVSAVLGDNVDFIVNVLTFALAIRVGFALLAWYRNRGSATS